MTKGLRLQAYGVTGNGAISGAPTIFINSRAKVAVAVVVVGEALFLDVPEEFEAAFGEDGGVGHVDAGFVGGAADGLGDA